LFNLCSTLTDRVFFVSHEDPLTTNEARAGYQLQAAFGAALHIAAVVMDIAWLVEDTAIMASLTIVKVGGISEVTLYDKAVSFGNDKDILSAGFGLWV